MKPLRIVLAGVIVVALCLIGWQAFLRPRSVGGLPAAPSFSAVPYGRTSQIAFPGDYAGKWIWLMFSGKD